MFHFEFLIFNEWLCIAMRDLKITEQATRNFQIPTSCNHICQFSTAPSLCWPSPQFYNASHSVAISAQGSRKYWALQRYFLHPSQHEFLPSRSPGKNLRSIRASASTLEVHFACAIMVGTRIANVGYAAVIWSCFIFSKEFS